MDKSLQISDVKSIKDIENQVSRICLTARNFQDYV